jgi:drug/metabolite transporter (DMT)-like permease
MSVPTEASVDQRRAALWAMVVQTLIASLAHIFGRTASLDFHPLVLPFLRMLGASTIFAVIFFSRGGLGTKQPTRLEWVKLAALAFSGITLNQTLYLSSLKYTSSANVALFYAMTPLAVLGISTFITKTEQPRGVRLLGVGLAVSGALIVIFARGGPSSNTMLLGNALAVIAVMCWAIYLSFSRVVLVGYDSFQATALLTMLGTLIYSPLGFYELKEFDASAISVQGWFGLFYIVVFMSVAMYALLNFALSKLESSQVSIFMNAQPVCTALFAAIFFGESLTIHFALGTALAISGIFLMQRPS